MPSNLLLFVSCLRVINSGTAPEGGRDVVIEQGVALAVCPACSPGVCSPPQLENIQHLFQSGINIQARMFVSGSFKGKARALLAPDGTN